MASLIGLRKFRILPSMVFVSFVIAACATAPVQPPAPISSGQPRPEPPPIQTPTEDVTDTKPVENTPIIRAPELSKIVTPTHMQGRDVKRIGVLLPFSHSSSGVREQASGLLAAIEMALFDQGNEDILLLPKDTAGDARKAASAAREAIDEGAQIIVGPLFADSVRAANGVASAKNIPVMAFSNDRSAAGSGAYLVSFPPEEEVSRIVDWASLNGMSRFAFMGPNTNYSRRVETALRFEAARRGGSVIASEFYSPQNDAPVDEASRVANRMKQALTGNDPSKIAVLITDRGVRLRGVAPLLPYYGVNLRRIQYIGTSIWDDPAIWREPVLENAAYAAPSPEDQELFEEGFEVNYGSEPASLSSLGYDAAALAISFLSDDGRVADYEITDLDGFRGVNGLFRFRSDGTVQRGLTVMGIKPNGPEVIDPAPNAFQPVVN